MRTGEERRSVPEWEGDGLCDCQPSALNHRNRTAARGEMSMNTCGTTERRDGLTGRPRPVNAPA
uniref:hypothetical protein n=1 Tax=Pantoea ananas TaxID=553 RepID=UPI001C930968